MPVLMLVSEVNFPWQHNPILTVLWFLFILKYSLAHVSQIPNRLLDSRSFQNDSQILFHSYSPFYTLADTLQPLLLLFCCFFFLSTQHTPYKMCILNNKCSILVVSGSHICYLCMNMQNLCCFHWSTPSPSCAGRHSSAAVHCCCAAQCTFHLGSVVTDV